MELSQITCAMAVVEAGSFTKAAEALFLSPQTVKNQIDALELELGCTLFERSAKGAKATEGGMVVYKRGAEIAAAVARLKNEARNVQRKNLVRLACPRGSSQPLRDRICSDFKKKYPGIEIRHVPCEVNQNVVACLMERRADVAFGSRPDVPGWSEVLACHACEGVPSSSMVAIVGRDNPLSRRKFVSPHELSQEHARLLRGDIALPDSLKPFIDARKCFTDQYEAIDYMLSGGVCVTSTYMPLEYDGMACVPIDVSEERVYVIADASPNSATASFVEFCARWQI